MAEIVRPAWMTDEMWGTWQELYLDAGGDGVAGAAERATDLFRQDSRYEQWFPGIKTEDGTIRYTDNPEQTYYANIRSFRNIVDGLGLNPELFASEYIDLIRGDVSPNEFSMRTDALHSRIMGGANEDVRRWFAENRGIDMTDEALLAAVMSPNIERAMLNKEITMAEIGGTASRHKFDLSVGFVDELVRNGMNRQEAQQLFGTAESLVPMLSAMASRHGDPDDDFDIYEFLDANEFMNPTQMRRIDRMQSQEAAMFTGGAQIDYTRSRSGGLSGLAEV